MKYLTITVIILLFINPINSKEDNLQEKGIPPKVIREIFKENIPQLKHCYQKILDTSKKRFNFKAIFHLKINENGNINEANIEAEDTGLQVNKVKKCMISTVKIIKFPKPKGGGTVEVTQPFNFYPQKKKKL